LKPISVEDGISVALDAILNNQLALLAGAGLSMAPPSNLPSAWRLAEGARSRYAAQYGATRPPLSDNIEEQANFFFQRDELATTYLSTLIDRNAFAGRPNAGHYAVADLMLSKAVQTVVTTNVDTLIEGAGLFLFGQVEVGIDGLAVAAIPATKTPMLKVHGCRMIDPGNTISAPSQLDAEPVRSRIACSAPWLQQRLLNRDLLIVGYWTDWDYLNTVLTDVLGAVNPSRVIVVDPADRATFPEKAAALYALGNRAHGGFQHVQTSGADFLACLRKAYSQSFIRQVLYAGLDSFMDTKTVSPDPGWLEPPDIDNNQLWLMRRDLLGCEPNEPASITAPLGDPLLGMTLLQLRAAGATPSGSYYMLGGLSVRVLRTPNKLLHKVESEYARDAAPAVAPDIVVAVGAEARTLPVSIARSPVGASIARGAASRWLTRGEAEAELGL
jgi:hypothetical protein